ncbi:glycosyltransferase family 4 protein [Ruminococcus sp. OA3]|uniref:glycosyltransferase family 4 protein n=1 Tax=Ruminococcus sp. OA3 TaxID=2914164 RepID=UPI001F06623A|nr:glycosyltransferase family 4 protein [Ruminococcus sp. OA3]MCH1982167.1 glycosyltransferase family 4 protein [Ruminococcus sp. OA3]
MKKVLLVTHVGDFIPQFEMRNVRYLQSIGYEVHYAADFKQSSYGNSAEKLKGSGVVCHQVPFERSPFKVKNIHAYRVLKELLASEHFELIHCHTPMGGAMARLAGRTYRKRGLKIIYTAHGFHFFKGAPLINWMIYYPVERLLSRWTDVQITINREDYQRARKFHANKVVRIPGVGIDLSSARERKLLDKEAFRRSLGVGPDDFCLLSVGELDANKNHVVVLEALQKMDRSNIRYLICGKGCLQDRLAREISDKGLSDCVSLLGYRDDVEQIYEAADLFVFPSHREGLSVALMESMAKGLPALASRIRGNVDLIEEGRGGILVSSREPDEFADGIRRLKRDPELCRKMGAYNQRAVVRYDTCEVEKVMSRVYHEVLG